MKQQFRSVYWCLLLSVLLQTWHANSLFAQQKVVSVKTEEDVISNSDVQRIGETNKLLVVGPLVPIGDARHPIIYSIRAEIEGDKVTTALIVTFDTPDEFLVFTNIVNEEGKTFPTAPLLQQEIQGRKDTAYNVGLSEEYLSKAKQGLKWTFQGAKGKTKIEVPGFFFSGFAKKVAAVRKTVTPLSADESLIFSGSIGQPSAQKLQQKKEFHELKDFIGEKLIFVPLSGIDASLGYGLKIADSRGRPISGADLAGKEIELVSQTKTELGDTYFGAKLAERNGLVVASSDFITINPLRGLVPKSEIERARTDFRGKTLWMRTNKLLTYDAVTGKSEFHQVKRLQPVTVDKVVLGCAVNPVRLIVHNENGDQFYQEYTCLGGRFREIGASTFDELFYTEDPRKMFEWTPEVVKSIEDSTIHFGMTQPEVIAAWDEPEKKNVVSSSGARLEQWVYGDQYIYLEDGKYINYQKFNSN